MGMRFFRMLPEIRRIEGREIRRRGCICHKILTGQACSTYGDREYGRQEGITCFTRNDVVGAVLQAGETVEAVEIGKCVAGAAAE